MLGAEKITSVSAFTSLLQKHLPPVDTVDSIMQAKSGISGTFCLSFGSTLSHSELTVGCENGSVTVNRSTVTTRQGDQKDGNATVKEFNDEGAGVKQEVKAWGESLVAGKANPKQSPEEALADLEILEKLLKSGEQAGKPLALEFQ